MVESTQRWATGGRFAAVAVAAARIAWVVTAVWGGRAVGAALADHAPSPARLLTVGAWLGWTAGALALLVPGVTTLTVARAVVPGALVVAVAAAVGGAPAWDLVGLVVPAAAAAVLVGSAELGRTWVQASAYGDEQRLPLGPPFGYLAAAVGSWLVWATAVVVGAIALAHEELAIALPAILIALVGTWALPRRWHQLSRRWLVVVPAGLVVHDPVVLADTLMLPRRTVVDVGIVPAAAATGAADLTGPRPGPALTIELAEAATAVLAPDRDHPQGRAIHLLGLAIAPSRPGAALEHARRRTAAASG